MLTPKEYSRLRKRYAAFEAWRGGRSSYPTASVPVRLRVSNAELSAIEVYEFCADKPTRYFLYINEGRRIAATWTGDPLGAVGFGSPFRANMGDLRVPITVYAINGLTYYGTYYKSAGDYARIKVAKKNAR
jgi:hypothetical protein